MAENNLSADKRTADHRDDEQLGTFVRRLKTVGWVAFLVLATNIGFYACTFSGGISTSNDHWGQFGDYLGAAGTIISLLGLFALLLTLTIQMRELSEMSTHLTIQNQGQAESQISANFFQMLDLHNTNVNALRHVTRTMVYATPVEAVEHGRDAIKIFADPLSEPSLAYYQTPDIKDIALGIFDSIYKQHRASLGHYYRGMYRIFKYLSTNTILSHAQKGDLARIARAQLSDDELILLFINCLAPQGQKFKKYVEEFHLLKNLDWTRIEVWSTLKSEYNETAFLEPHPRPSEALGDDCGAAAPLP